MPKRETQLEARPKDPKLRRRSSAGASFFRELKERKIVQTMAALVGFGWLVYEIVHWILVVHFHLPEGLLDITLVTLFGTFLSVVIWLWFRSSEKRARGVKFEVLLVPLIILLTLAVDVNLVFQIRGDSGRSASVAVIAAVLGLTWIIFKSLQWAAGAQNAAVEEIKEFIAAELRPGKSIVVLPFKNISPEEGQDYLSDGITDEVIADLSGVRAFRVISRSSAMAYKDSNKTVPEIAKDLNVRYVLEGSVRKAGENLKITAQLIEAESDTHVWAEKFAGSLADVFDMQEKVSRAIVFALKQRLAPDEERTITERPIQNVRAYEAYLMARRDMYQCSEESMERALQSLAKAVEIYGESAILYAAMGLVHVQLYNMGFRTTEDTLKKSEKFLDKIIALEPESSHRYHLMGSIERSRGHPQKAVLSLKKAADIDPNDPDTLGWLGNLLSLYLGRPDLGKPHIKRLIEIDPLVAWNYYVASVYYLARGKLERALSMMRRAVQLDPEDRNLRFWESWYLGWNNQPEEAIERVDRIVAENPHDFVAFLSTMLKCALQNERDRALQALSKDKRSILSKDPEGPWLMACCFARLNDKAEALSWLERAVARGWANYPLFSKIDPFLESLRGEARFEKLMARVKRDWESFEI